MSRVERMFADKPQNLWYNKEKWTSLTAPATPYRRTGDRSGVADYDNLPHRFRQAWAGSFKGGM